MKRFESTTIDRCGVDKYILQNPTYINDLMVGQEAHVFKYADKPLLFFNCQIELKLKEGQTCEVCYQSKLN